MTLQTNMARLRFSHPQIIALTLFFSGILSTVSAQEVSPGGGDSVQQPAATKTEDKTDAATTSENSSPKTTSVGMSRRVEQVVIPGPKLEAKPVTSDSPLVLRIANVYPHGSDFRYDLEFYALDPGEYDLVKFLKRADGQPIETDVKIMVTVEPILPPGQVEPSKLPAPSIPALGGYQLMLIAAGIVWVLGLLALIFAGRSKSQSAAQQAAKPVSLAERLEPTVAAAVEGRLSREKCADLEMMLVAYWRKRLQLENKPAANVILELKDHDEAGPLLRQLERWLHEPDNSQDVNVAELLKPYEKIPASDLEPQTEGAIS